MRVCQVFVNLCIPINIIDQAYDLRMFSQKPTTVYKYWCSYFLRQVARGFWERCDCWATQTLCLVWVWALLAAREPAWWREQVSDCLDERQPVSLDLWRELVSDCQVA